MTAACWYMAAAELSPRALTGLRRKELKFLRWGDIRLDAPHPFIQLRTEQTKNGRADQLLLHPDLVTMLKRKRRGLPSASVFYAVPCMASFKSDLAAAKIRFEDDLGRRADFHALRHSYCTLVAQSGATMKEAQVLMRHSDPKLTANVYAHVGLFDTAGALAGVNLPKLGDQVQMATGTNSAILPDCWKTVGETSNAQVDNQRQPETVGNDRRVAASSTDSSENAVGSGGNDTTGDSMS